MNGVIVYYAVSPVHLRNTQLIAAGLEEWTLRIAYERDSPWLNAEAVAGVPGDALAFSPSHIPEPLWEGSVKAVLFSTLQPRSGPVALLAEAIRRGIPTVALEESNQIALNQGAINNYLLPADRVLVASEHERRGMIDSGLPAERFEVTGWPFYSGRTGKVSPEHKTRQKEILGLDPKRPVAALTLTGLYNAGSGEASRKRELTLAAQGLPEDYQLAVKPHPTEPLKMLAPFLEECAPASVAIEGMVPIEELLDASDLLLNRGASQVCFEALLQDVPVVVLDTGIETPFHHLAREVVVGTEQELRDAVRYFGDVGMTYYKPLLEAHLPLAPESARALTCDRIEAIAVSGLRDAQQCLQAFDLALFQAWLGEGRRALETLQDVDAHVVDIPLEPFARLIGRRASRQDLAQLQEDMGSGFRLHLLKSLWVRQLVMWGERPSVWDVRWLDGFPPSNNPVWYLATVREWAFHLARSGQVTEATDFVEKVHEAHPFVPEFAKVKNDMGVYLSGWRGRLVVSGRNRLVTLLKRWHRTLQR